VRIISNGEYQLAMVSVSGWDKMETVESEGLHPMSLKSGVINVSDTYLPQKNHQKIFCTLMLWKKANEHWTTDELVPVLKVNILENSNAVRVTFTDRTTKVVQFSDPVK